MLRLALVVIVAMCGTVRAQQRAVEVTSAHRHHPEPAVGVVLSYGSAGQLDGPAGWVARLESEVLSIYETTGAVLGLQSGPEVWSSGENNWGFSLPVACVLGARLVPFRALVGVGLDAILVDQVDDDTGLGFYAPFALAKLGIDVRGFQIGADARIGYRWQIGAEDHARWQLGMFVAKTFDAPRAREQGLRASRTRVSSLHVAR